jgi:MYXO-CTERM domain-containing protein
MSKLSWIVATAIVAAAASISSPAPAAPHPKAPNGDLARVIDALAKRGSISAENATRLARAAIEQGEGPSVVAPRSHSGHIGCLSHAMHEAKKWIHTQGADILSVPPPSVGYVESTLPPIRVYYPTEGDKPMAEYILPLAVDAWTRQVKDTGYMAPFTGDDKIAFTPGHWIYIGDTGMGGGGYTEWLEDIPITPIADCSSRVVIDPMNGNEFLPIVVAHEFNHATQMATDCIEAISAWENFANAADQYFVDDWQFPYLIELFQKYPEYPIDYWQQGDGQQELGYYQYGAAMFPIFLMERFGNGDIKMLRDLWASFAQAGTLSCSPWGCNSDQPNTPNWFEGTDNVLKLHGSTFDEAFAEFSTWRAITDYRDDGKHFSKGSQYALVAAASTHSLTSLPVNGEFDVYEYGSRYVELTPDSYKGKVHVQVKVDPEAKWSAALLLGRPNQPVERVPLDFVKSVADLYLPTMSGVMWSVLAVSQYSEGQHNPDDQDYNMWRLFSYVVNADGDPDAGPGPEPVPEPAPEAGPDAKPKDAGKESAALPADAQDTPAAIETSPSDGGCGCELPGHGSKPSAAVVALLAIAALARMIKRRA